jgi:hypothetical protein
MSARVRLPNEIPQDAFLGELLVSGPTETSTRRILPPLQAGAAPPVLLAATHIKALDFVSLAELKQHALDAEEAEAEAAASKAASKQQQCSSEDEGGSGRAT